MTEQPPRIFDPPPPKGLVFRGFRLCHGCSRGQHHDHAPVNCDCDLC